MSLIELKRYLQTIKTGNLFQLAHYFNADPETVRLMLAQWEKKGCVRKCPKIAGCGSKCSKCDPLLTEVYEWVDIPR